MNREQFDHAIRAAGAILGANEVLVIGSQAIHGLVDIEIPEAERSIGVDVSAMNDDDGSMADLIDGSIGELSVFQETFGYYAQGVTPDTAILPSGWRRRLVSYESPSTNGVTAFCLEIHDLWISKAIANRTKDREFCRALLERKLVDTKTLRARLKKVSGLASEMKTGALSLIEAEAPSP